MLKRFCFVCLFLSFKVISSWQSHWNEIWLDYPNFFKKGKLKSEEKQWTDVTGPLTSLPHPSWPLCHCPHLPSPLITGWYFELWAWESPVGKDFWGHPREQSICPQRTCLVHPKSEFLAPEWCVHTRTGQRCFELVLGPRQKQLLVLTVWPKASHFISLSLGFLTLPYLSRCDGSYLRVVVKAPKTH
jgi:hypothetical protein